VQAKRGCGGVFGLVGQFGFLGVLCGGFVAFSAVSSFYRWVRRELPQRSPRRPYKLDGRSGIGTFLILIVNSLARLLRLGAKYGIAGSPLGILLIMRKPQRGFT